MAKGHQSDIAAGRLDADEYAVNFADLHPRLTGHQAAVEADRCYFCHDAPCTEACPTGIDIPLFIRQIYTGDAKGAAETIFSENILGGMCARVCPTETLCEEACVRNECEEKPVTIGMLQRFATDHYLDLGAKPVERAAPTGKSVAVVGAGPAGLSCAHALAAAGHDITLYDARPKLGGLSEYGIAAYKTVDNFAQREVEFILSIGGITVQPSKALGRDIRLADLRHDHDAVFLGIGLGGVNDLGIDDAGIEGIVDAVDYIADLRQADDLRTLPVGRNVVVIGGGMTAIDIAVQSRRLGAEDVTIVYRRGPEQMGASRFEQDLAQTDGVRIRHWAKPIGVTTSGSAVRAMTFERTALDKDGRLTGTGETYDLAADMVFKAIGQTFLSELLGEGGPALERGRINVDAARRTSLANVWAGGDCVAGGDDLTVSAVQDGKLAAKAIDAYLQGKA